MPVRRFWLLHANTIRISASQDMRLIRMKMAMGNKDEFPTYREELLMELGNVQQVEESLDREGLKSLAAMA